jgi:2-methylisocitrate lyase-like PEP mutase family enzyme
MLDADALQEMGFDLVIFPGGIVRALARAAQEYYQSLHAHRSTVPFRDRMFDFDALNALIGTPATLEAGKRFASGPKGKPTATKLGKTA